MSDWIAPMKAISAPDLPTGEGWAFELKWDGMRLLARCGRSEQPGGDLVLRSTSGRDVTSSFPELADLPAQLGAPAVLDGEAVVFDGDRPSFGLLQNRMHVERPSQSLVTSHPVVYVVFDLLELDGRSLIELPYQTRREVLVDFLEPGPAWHVPSVVIGDGERLLALADERGLEGVVAKRLTSRYQPGTRTTEWLKIKVRRRQEFVVVGWLPGQGKLEGQIGSLLLGVYDDSRLVFAGAVGSGLADRDRAQLAGLLVARAECPLDAVPPLLKPPTWVEPTEVADVEYGSWPADGLLRHPVYVGLRADHDPRDVVRELPP